MESINALGRRKAAVARVYLSDGKGKITVNGRDYKEYFGAETLQYVVTQPLVLLMLLTNMILMSISMVVVLKDRLKLFVLELQELLL